jgi:hypothetical protein
VCVRKTIELLEFPARYDRNPKTQAGKREISMPPHVLTFLVQHAEQWPARSSSSSAATATGCGVTRSTRRSCGHGARSASNRLPDLRHTGQSLAAAGPPLADLKKRLGHSATANRYLHALDRRDAEAARALSDLSRRAKERADYAADDPGRMGATGRVGHDHRDHGHLPALMPAPEKRKVGGSNPPLSTTMGGQTLSPGHDAICAANIQRCFSSTETSSITRSWLTRSTPSSLSTMFLARSMTGAN